MDMPRSEVRKLRFDEYSATKHLEHATRQAYERNYQDFLIVDVDSHHYENESYKEVFSHRDIAMTKLWMDAMGVDYTCLFPTPMLFLGLHPQTEVEVAMAQGYNRWLCERILAAEPRLISMLYLPFNDPEAAYKTVKEFGEKKGVVGFMVTSPRYKPVHDNAYVKTYALLEEMGKPISFHAAY